MKPATGVLMAVLALQPAAAGRLDAADEAAAPGGAEEAGLLERIDFGNAYVMGQALKSGAVYLLNRKQSDIHTMLRTRTDFRREIREDAETVTGRVPGEAAAGESK